ncbi:LuxR C-terminal-related transcriptional regulator (plasmid) [Streptomyces sp. R39]|uniref:LuxR C-terminal-related transcriptional regulator n=1 Tax=Streptomyces sp. R39 TaxID=3238631 RepID=A0AB39R6H7_9ACTN
MNLYGRFREQLVIGQRIARTQRGQSNLILLRGPKGYGKTVLVDRIIRLARRASFDVASGRIIHYKRLLLAASLMAVSTHPQTISGSPGQAVAAPGPDLLGEALGAVLPGRRQGAARPVLIALDDVAWGDPDILAALRWLPAAPSNRPVLWLLSGTGGPTPHVLSSHPDAVCLTLGPLRRPDALRMAAGRLGGSPDVPTESLITACGGHPALLGAVLDELAACVGYRVRGGIAGLASTALPPHVVTTLLRADPRLSGPTLDLLRLVAAGQIPPQMSRLIRLPDGRAVSALGSVREATEAGVLVLDGDRLRFRHPLLNQAADLLRCERSADDGERGLLTATEQTITRLVATGLTNRQIASRVNLSPHTVNFHLRKIFQKLGVSSRVELVGTRLHLLRPAFDTDPTPPAHESRQAHAG